MNELSPRLRALGDDLHRAARADLHAARRARRIRHRVVAAAACLVAIPGAAFAADQLLSPEDVARSLPAGTLSLAGTEPTCKAEIDGVQYLCTLAHAPAPEVEDWKGAAEPTVDATEHVNGGCRGLTSDGRQWRCYIGLAAVRQKIVSAGFLGDYAPGPAQG